MSKPIQIVLHHPEQRVYINMEKLIQFKITDTKGFFTFDGYLYNKFEGEENTYEPIPKSMKMLVYYKNCKFAVYTVKLLKRELLKNTETQTITFEILSES
jgi:hypothetical protein